MLTVLQPGGVDSARDWAALVEFVHHLLLAVAHTVLLNLVLLVVLHSETVRLAPWLAVTALVLGCARVIDRFVLLASARDRKISGRNTTLATYVSSGIPPLSCTNWKAPVALPPWHDPATFVPQLRITWIAKLISGHCALRMILMRSAIEDIAP